MSERKVLWGCLSVLAGMALFVVLNGCAALNRAEQNRVAKAVDIVFNKVYESAKCKPPTVKFEEPSTCEGGFIGYDGRCWLEEYNHTENTVTVVTEGGTPLYTTQFAHGLLHAAIWCWTGTGDPSHTLPAWDFMPDKANAALVAGGGL